MPATRLPGPDEASNGSAPKTLYLCEGDAFRAVALHNTPPALAQALENVGAAGPHVPLGRVAATRTMAHIADMMNERCYIERDPLAVMGVESATIAPSSPSRC